jgi:hypothetical protein
MIGSCVVIVSDWSQRRGLAFWPQDRIETGWEACEYETLQRQSCQEAQAQGSALSGIR